MEIDLTIKFEVVCARTTYTVFTGLMYRYVATIALVQSFQWSCLVEVEGPQRTGEVYGRVTSD